MSSYSPGVWHLAAFSLRSLRQSLPASYTDEAKPRKDKERHESCKHEQREKENAAANNATECLWITTAAATQQQSFVHFLSDHKCQQLLSYIQSEETPQILPLLKSAIKSWGSDHQGSVADVCDLSAMDDGIVCWPAVFICFPLVYIHEQKCKINLVTQHVCTTSLHTVK